MDDTAANTDISVYDRMCWPEAQLEQALATGAHPRELRAYFGSAEYGTLAALARRAASAPLRHPDTHVYILPGIMGSQLGRPRPGAPPDLLWMDPLDIQRGRLVELGPGGSGLVPLGGIPYSYLPLKLRLRASGFAATVFDYDWRCDLAAIAVQLAQRLAAEPAARVALVGHSMGGLLARAVLKLAGARLDRILLLGTPNLGAVAAVQALRATYPVVCRLAALDPAHSADQLTDAAFRHFPSLYQLLPQPAVHGGVDIFDASQWPAEGPRPDARLLAAADRFARGLAPVDERCTAIVGTGQRTATALQRQRGQFVYDITSLGDGTVAAASARIEGGRNHYLRCEHSALPRHPAVAAVIADLLRQGRTRRLSTRWRGTRAAAAAISVSDAVLRRSLDGKVDWAALGPQARRRYFDRLNRPPPAYRSAPRPAARTKTAKLRTKSGYVNT